ncbi:hypothetical protein SAY87_015432 [Trapa incisa]|uniref:Uncharacterized protein n=1 Tax=Trapa incisa TaxID=236973 RepID=A0AAN7GQ50_9MYRT|nr:hypothetical protein SAY87_015432 [Trapa incisa]
MQLPNSSLDESCAVERLTDYPKLEYESLSPTPSDCGRSHCESLDALSLRPRSARARRRSASAPLSPAFPAFVATTGALH